MKKFPNFPISQFLYILAIIVISTIAFFYFYKPEQTKGAWWNDSWAFRKSVQITNSASAQTKVYLALTINTATTTQFQTDCGDLRFTKYNGELLPYLIESGCGTATTSVLVAFDTLPAGEQTIFYYYGNPSVEDGFAVSQNGTVTQANMRLSIASSTAFVDFSAGNALTANLGKRLVIADGVGKKLVGHTKVAGTGETLDTNVFNNLNFQSGWTFLNTSAISVNSLNVTADYGYAAKNHIFNVGACYKISYIATTSAGFTRLNGLSSNPIFAYSGDIGIYRTTANNIFSVWSDSIAVVTVNTLSFQQILTPSPTGTTISSTQNGSTYDWKSEDSGFNRNDSAGYSYKIYPVAFSTEAASFSVGVLGAEEKGPGPVGYWSFDEGQGATAHDGTANGNDGVVTGAVWKPGSECVSGRCLGFGTSGKYVSRVDQGINDPLRLASGEITLEAWIKSASSTIEQKIIDKRANWNGLYGYSMYISPANLLGFEYGNGTAYVQAPKTSTGSAFTANTWHYVVITLSGSTISYYIDGKSYGTQTGIVGIAGDSTTFSIGYSVGRSLLPFIGSIDEPKVYSYARSATQIKQDYASGLAGLGQASGNTSATIGGGGGEKWMTDGLVGYWKMDESSGTTSVDSSGNGNNGTLYNMQETGTAEAASASTTVADADNASLSTTTNDIYNNMILRITGGSCGITAGTERLISAYASSTRTVTVFSPFSAETDNCTFEIRHQGGGKFGNGLMFDGVGDSVRVIQNSTINDLNKITISAWVYLYGAGENSAGRIIDKNNDYVLFSNGSTLTFTAKRWTVSGEWGVAGLASNSWYFVSVTYDYSNILNVPTFYINGVKKSGLVVGRTPVAPIISSTHDLYIGNVPESTRTFYGKIDETRIYNRALSPLEIKKLYEWAPGPVGFWKMDEMVKGSGKTILDSSGYGNNGTTYYGGNASGMDCTQPGKYGSACLFDGVDDYVDAGTSAILFPKNALTIEAWIKPETNQDGEATTLGYIAGINGYWDGFGMWVDESKRIWFELKGSSYVKFSNNDVMYNQWNHIVGLYDGSNMNIFINGKQSGPSVARIGLVDVSNSSFRVGKVNANDYKFKGQIDDVRIYNYARTQKQILEDMDGGSGSDGGKLQPPIAYYNFDEGFGAVAHNSGLGCTDLLKCVSTNGTLDAGASGANTSATMMWDLNGKQGWAVEFDGVDDYVNTGLSTHFTQTSITAWIKPKSVGENQLGRIIDKQGGGDIFLVFFSSNNNLYFGRKFSVTSGSWYTPVNSVTIGNWQHIALVYDDSSISNYPKIFINGKIQPFLVETAPVGVASTTSTSYLIGNNSTLARTFDGLIDDFKIYNYLLTDADIKTDYNSGQVALFGSAGTASTTGQATRAAGGEYCVPGSTDYCAGPMGEWKMEEKVKGDAKVLYDTSGNGNNGTTVDGANNTGMDCSKPGKAGTGCRFDGVDDYVNMSDIFYSDVLTVCSWYKTSVTNPAVVKGIVVKRNIGINSSDNEWNLFTEVGDVSGVVGFISWNSAGAIAFAVRSREGAIKANEWQHLCAVQRGNGNIGYLYLDGKIVGTSTQTSVIKNTASAIQVGARINDGDERYWDGYLDQVRIYNYARTPAQIAWEYNKGKPVAEWRFNECQGSVVHDESGNGNNGTISLGAGGVTALGTCANSGSTAWWNGRVGKFGAGLSFDSTDDTINIPSSNTVKPNIITISAWIKPDTLNDYWIISTQTSDPYDYNHGYVMRIEYPENYVHCIFGKNSSAVDTTHELIDAGIWKNVVCSFDGTSVNIFINGKLAGQTVSAGALDYTGTSGLYISGHYGTSRYFDGQIDEVKIFNYALTAEQVKMLYNNSSIVNFQ